MSGTDKVTRILDLYTRLHLGEEINKSAFSIEHNINERSTDRDIEDIRIFLSETYSYRELNYDKNKKVYYLTNCSKNSLSSVEVVTLLKILINSRALRIDEMSGMVNSILSLVSFYDKDKIKKLISTEIENYVPPKHNKAILKMQWDLNESIAKMQKVKLKYKKMNGSLVERIVLPLSVIVSEYYFYLIAYIDGKEYKYPAFFRLDRIYSFIVLDEYYSKDLLSKYNVGEMRKFIKFMHGGDLIEVKLKVKEKDLNMILDQLPNAEIIENKKDFIVIKANVFKDGFIKWLLHNSDNLEIIEPLSLRNEFKEELIKILDKY